MKTCVMRHCVTLTGVLVGLAGIMGACAMPQEGDVDQPVGEAKEAFSSSLLYEGTCAYLRAKSGPSQGVAAPNVMWGCTGIGYCDDATEWAAAPTKANCGDTIQICKGGLCTQAVVKDVSNRGAWEAGNAVMNALHAPYGTLLGADISVVSAGCHGQYSGFYCGGDSIGGNPNYLYYCPQKYAQPVIQACCARGCQPAGAQHNDYCR